MIVILIIKAIFSTFAIILLGFFSKKFNVLGKNSTEILTNFVYYFALPAILFVAIANEPLSQSLNLPFIYAFTSSVIIIFLFGLAVSRIFFTTTIKSASMHAFAISSPNVAFMGIPVLVSLFGEKAILPIAISTILLALTTIVTIILLETNDHKNHSMKSIILKIFATFIKNPLAIAPLTGILFALTGWELPSVINGFAHQLGATAGPCALFAIGETLVGSKIFTEKAEFGVIGLGKLILHPLLVLPLIFIFHVTPFWAACGFILASFPCAATVYIVACKYKIYEQQASALIVETTLFSIITLSIVITIAALLWPNVVLR